MMGCSFNSASLGVKAVVVTNVSSTKNSEYADFWDPHNVETYGDLLVNNYCNVNA